MFPDELNILSKNSPNFEDNYIRETLKYERKEMYR